MLIADHLSKAIPFSYSCKRQDSGIAFQSEHINTTTHNHYSDTDKWRPGYVVPFVLRDFQFTNINNLFAGKVTEPGYQGDDQAYCKNYDSALFHDYRIK
jgi:hypothetical protein